MEWMREVKMYGRWGRWSGWKRVGWGGWKMGGR